MPGHQAFYSPIGTPVRAIQIAPAVNGDRGQSDLWVRCENAKKANLDNAKLIEELLAKNVQLTRENEQLTSAVCGREDMELARNWQREKRDFEENIRSYQNILARNPYIVVLIDGDGMVFQDEFIREGDTGGRKAAAQLQNEIETWIHRENKNIPLDCRIICRVYANVKGLANVLVRAGIIEEVSFFEEFVRGFTRSKSLFDFVDVGSGKDRADEKMRENFKLFLPEFHCRQIFFGCSHDNGFARVLEEYMNDTSCLLKVTLLEGVPFEKELLALPYSTKKFPAVFREAKINVYGSPTPRVPPVVVQKNYNVLTGLPTCFPAPIRVSSDPIQLGESPMFTNAGPLLSRTPSASSKASDGLPAAIKPVSKKPVAILPPAIKPVNPPAMMNWAAKAAAPAPPIAHTTPKYESVNREEAIARNRAGQRVDPQTREYDKTEVDRVKKIKMCNVHFLRRECQYGNNCTHLHNYEPTTSELNTLRLVARMAPCSHGSGCDDVKCIYGHRCPAPASKSSWHKGSKSCIFGDACKFPADLHDLDCNIVKTLVVR